MAHFNFISFLLMVIFLSACTPQRKADKKLLINKGSRNICECVVSLSRLDLLFMNECEDSLARSNWINAINRIDGVTTIVTSDSLEVRVNDTMGMIYTFCKGYKTGKYENGEREGRWLGFDREGNIKEIFYYMDGAVWAAGRCENGEFRLRYRALLWLE